MAKYGSFIKFGVIDKTMQWIYNIVVTEKRREKIGSRGLPGSHLYSIKVGEGMKQMGFKSPPPDNKFYHFKKGEELVWYREGGSERGAIRYSDGHEVDLDQWINSYDVSQELDQTPKHKEISDRIGSVARDISFATMYFMEAPKGMAEAIAEIIISDADKGELVIAVDEKGYTDKDKKKLAAYRVIARNLGFAVGKFHKEGGFATAVIRPRDS